MVCYLFGDFIYLLNSIFVRWVAYYLFGDPLLSSRFGLVWIFMELEHMFDGGGLEHLVEILCWFACEFLSVFFRVVWVCCMNRYGSYCF